MFKALFVPQGFLTLAALALLGYRHWTGDWPSLTDGIPPQTAPPALSWDRQPDAWLEDEQYERLKRAILDQLDRMTPPEAARQP